MFIQAHLVSDLRVGLDSRRLDLHVHLVGIKVIWHNGQSLLKLIKLLLRERPLELRLTRWPRMPHDLRLVSRLHRCSDILVLERRLAILVRATTVTAHLDLGVGKCTHVHLSILGLVVAGVRVDVVCLQVLSVDETA